jgi:hypothetical protein
MKRWLRRTCIGLAGAMLAIQLVPAERTNPAAESDLAAPDEVKAILRRSCYDCHSNETHWPWYAYVAPVSWFLARDVKGGRTQLNFSKWGEYTAKKRHSKADDIVEQVTGGNMPLASYVFLHRSARLDAHEIELLKQWADGDP